MVVPDQLWHVGVLTQMLSTCEELIKSICFLQAYCRRVRKPTSDAMSRVARKLPFSDRQAPRLTDTTKLLIRA